MNMSAAIVQMQFCTQAIALRDTQYPEWRKVCSGMRDGWALESVYSLESLVERF